MTEQTMELLDVNLPEGWEKVHDHSNTANTALWWHAHAPGNDEVEIGRWIFIKKKSELEKLASSKLFNAPPHTISPDEEIKTIAFLRQGFPYGYESKPKAIYTKTFAGRTCLFYDRDWLRAERRSIEILVDSAKDGEAVNHFYFIAPSNAYDSFLPVALDVFAKMYPVNL